MHLYALVFQSLKVLIIVIKSYNSRILLYVVSEGPRFPNQHKQGRKRPLDTPKRMIERREREGERERER